MVKYSNLDRVMESRDHFKNGASSKSQMIRGNIRITHIFSNLSKMAILTIFAFSMFSCKSSKTMVDTNVVFEFPEVDKPPMYNGKAPAQAFGEFVTQNIKYPPEAENKGIAGHVIVSFIIEKNGTVSNIKVLNGVDPLLDAEALRVTEKLSKTKWTPGIKDGKKVRVVLNHPISFRLNR